MTGDPSRTARTCPRERRGFLFTFSFSVLFWIYFGFGKRINQRTSPVQLTLPKSLSFFRSCMKVVTTSGSFHSTPRKTFSMRLKLSWPIYSATHYNFGSALHNSVRFHVDSGTL